MRQPLPLRMGDFDRRLEIELRHLLDPIVDAPVPRRRRLAIFRAIPGGLLEQAVELAVVVPEPAPVAVVPAGTPL